MTTVHHDVLPTLQTVPTPALVLDLDAFESNVAALARMVEPTGKRVRPHVKTHRTAEIARRQLGGPARGLTCATIDEVDAMAAAGLDGLLLANEVVEPRKLERLARLARTAEVLVVVDDEAPALALSSQAARAGATVGVLVDVDVALHRCGVGSGADALRLARVVDAAPGLRLRGVMGYEGRMRPSVEHRAARIADAYARLAEVTDTLRRAGLDVPIVSAGGTSTLPEALADPTVTEVQAGVYSLMEPDLAGMGLPFRCAVTVLGTVVSRHPDRLVVDIGRRSVGTDYGPPVPVDLDVQGMWVSDEHLTLTAAGSGVALGSRLGFTPGQIRTTFNLYDHVWVRRGDDLVDRWPISRRRVLEQD